MRYSTERIEHIPSIADEPGYEVVDGLRGLTGRIIAVLDAEQHGAGTLEEGWTLYVLVEWPYV